MVVRGLPHAGAGRHESDGLVVPQSAAALFALDDGDKPAPILLIEERVQNGVDAGIGSTQPLRYGGGDGQDLFLPHLYLSTELDPREDNVQRQPRQHKEDDYGHEHLDHLHLGLLLHPLHLSVLGVRRDGSPPHLDPDENVAHGDEDHGEDVAEEEVGDEEVKRTVEVIGPDLQAEFGLRGIFEDDHQIEVESPGDGGGEGDDPDDEYHKPGAALGDLALERPPDCQESGNKDNIYTFIF